MSGDWGYIGDDSYLNPAVEIDLNPLGAGEGVAVAKRRPMSKMGKFLVATASPAILAAKVAQAKKRPLTDGEKRELASMVRAKVSGNIRAMQQRVPTVAPPRAGAMTAAKALMNPVAAAKILAAPMIQKQIAKVKGQAIQAAKQQKLATRAEASKIKAEINAGIKTGTITPAHAKSIYANKVKELKGRQAAAMKNIKDTANKNIKGQKQVQAKIHAKLINKRDIAIDKKRQSIEDEIRRVSTSSMPEPGKSSTLAALKKRLANIDLAKKETIKRKQVATVVQMANKGVLPKAQAQKLAKDMNAKADAMERKRKVATTESAKIEKSKGRLYILGKWIQAYTSAIQYAQQMGVNSVVIPIGAMGKGKGTVRTPSKVVRSSIKKPMAVKTANGLSYIGVATTTPGPTINEVRMPLQTAKAKLEGFKMEYKKIEDELVKKAGGKELPIPKIQPVTQTGQMVTPEMLKAQESYLRSQIASGKINAIVGAQAIKQLQTVDKLMQKAHKPILQPTAKPRPTMIIQVFISPQAVSGIRSAERMITTKGGSAQTKVKLPKMMIPSAIPHATAKTTGTIANRVSTKPTRPPAIVAARPATLSTSASKMVGGAIRPGHTKPPATSLDRPGTIKMGYRKKPRTIAPFKKVSITDILNQATMPWPKR